MREGSPALVVAEGFSLVSLTDFIHTLDDCTIHIPVYNSDCDGHSCMRLDGSALTGRGRHEGGR